MTRLGFIAALLAALMAPPLWRGLGRLGDWFSAERGAGPGKNGWV